MERTRLTNELESWLEANRALLLRHPHSYLLVGMRRGIIAEAPTYEELIEKLRLLDPSKMELEDLMEPTYIISTLVVRASPYGSN